MDRETLHKHVEAQDFGYDELDDIDGEVPSLRRTIAGAVFTALALLGLYVVINL